MKNLLKLEELAQFLICLGCMIVLKAPWWCYLLLLLGPDIGMLGYLASPLAGAFTYNMLHHKGVAIMIIMIGGYMTTGILFSDGSWTGIVLLLAGIILYGHASLDRIFGYGLKFGDNFHHTHLGWIGKGVASSE
ncbi:MAG: DUF4260 domain-containing protein [Flavobacteriales bacterium]|nr:DUF4260 domain-containing protein [Flavobacteriales bacterium]